MEDGGRRLRVEVLGPLRAFADGQEIGLGAPKQRALFAALAMCADTVVARGELIDRIWGEDVPMTAAGNLHTYVSGLRRTLSGLGDPLVGGGSGYLLRLAPDALDLNRAERLAARARTARDSGDRQSAIAALDSALALWRGGRPLEALPGPFAAEQRARLASMRLRMLSRDRTELMIDEPGTRGRRISRRRPTSWRSMRGRIRSRATALGADDGAASQWPDRRRPGAVPDAAPGAG